MPLRATIVLLLVLNLGAAAWWLLHAPMPAPVVPTAPAGAARLSLAGDAGVAAVPAAAVPASKPPVAASRGVVPAPTPVAPASSGAPANAATAGAAVATCEGGAGAADGWRVYLPRLPTADAAQATAKRIADSGFSDYLVVVDGADANTIALGRYGTADAAQRRVASLRAAGFPARCARIPKATPA